LALVQALVLALALVSVSVSVLALVPESVSVLVQVRPNTRQDPPRHSNFRTVRGYRLASTTCSGSCARCTSHAFPPTHKSAYSTTQQSTPRAQETAQVRVKE
jgi:hypothetical protein